MTLVVLFFCALVVLFLPTAFVEFDFAEFWPFLRVVGLFVGLLVINGGMLEFLYPDADAEAINFGSSDAASNKTGFPGTKEVVPFVVVSACD